MPIIILHNCVYTVHWIQWLVYCLTGQTPVIIQEVGKKSGNCVARVLLLLLFQTHQWRSRKDVQLIERY